jgi:hypothetical protein
MTDADVRVPSLLEVLVRDDSTVPSSVCGYRDNTQISDSGSCKPLASVFRLRISRP